MARSRNKSPFDAESIQRLFGHEAAEDEETWRLREYYFKSSTYEQVVTGLPLRILVGHKGIGKSAMFQVAIAEGREANELIVVVKPDDIVDIQMDTADFLKSVRNWKCGIRGIVLSESARLLELPQTAINMESREPVSAYLKTKMRSVVPGNEVAHRFLQDPRITIYIDDLDRGWQGSKADVRRMSALLNSIRDLSNDDRGLRFRISLRSDVYFLVRTSDESTDKIEGSVIWNSWSNHEIFAMLVKRILTYRGHDVDYDYLAGRSQSQLAHYLDDYFDPRFLGKGHWSKAPTYRVLMSLIRKRPRDLVKLCTLSAKEASKNCHPKIFTKDLEASFPEYSQGRIQDTVNEYTAELPDIERLLFGMKPTRKEHTAKAGYVYTTDALFRKLKAIEERGRFTFSNGRPATIQQLAAFMYKINFVTARKESGGLIDRRYFEEQRYLQSPFADFGFDWEVHPAYRWALQPDNVDAIFESLRLSADEQ